MHDIVIIEIYSTKKWVNTLYTVVTSLSHIPPKHTKTREPQDKHCVSWCTYKSYYICNPIPLDNPKNHTALPYITLTCYLSVLLCVSFLCVNVSTSLSLLSSLSLMLALFPIYIWSMNADIIYQDDPVISGEVHIR